MSSQRRIESSRINGAKSHGPKTPEGKRKSSLNAITHGMCVGITVLKCEDPEGFRAILQQHIDRLQPVDEVEYGIIEELAASRWRMRRAWAGETETLDKQLSMQKDGIGIGQAFLWMADAPALTLAHRYENRQHIIYQRSLRSLKLLREMPMPDYGDDEITEVPSEPNPISEHAAKVVPIAPATSAQPIDPESFALPVRQASRPVAEADRSTPRRPSDAHPAAGPDGNNPGGAA